MAGLVTLLGAGPGDEELLTLKGQQRLKEADVIIYDRLVNKNLLRYAKQGCACIDVGKIPGKSCVTQDEITQLLIEKAKENQRVVRLKSGDPYIFGRGGEEGVMLQQAGIAFEVVPGVTSALAGLTYAGIPATYRDIATSVHIITGHLQDPTETLNWQAIAQLKGTLIFLMGMKNLPIITHELMAQGQNPQTPVAIIEWGTHAKQRSITGTLETIVNIVEQHQFGAPSLIVVGSVVNFKEQLNFHEKLPLFGQRILVQDSATGKLPKLLKEAGATLTTFPARDKVVPVDWALPDFTQKEGIIVTDSHGWTLFMEKLVANQQDIRQLAHLNIIAVGHHTAKQLRQAGINPNKCLTHWGTEALSSLGSALEKWLVLSEESRYDKLPQQVALLPTIITHKMVATQAFNPNSIDDGVDSICLPNSVAAETFVLMYQTYQLEQLKQVPIIIMGESTQSVLEKAGFTQLVVTEHATIANMVETTIRLKGE